MANLERTQRPLKRCKGISNLALAVSLVSAMGTFQMRTQEVLASPATCKVERPEKERPFEEKIKMMEQAFLELRDDVLPNLDRYVDDEKIREKIRLIFRILESNSKNPGRFDKPLTTFLGEENGFRYAAFEPDGVRKLIFNGKHRIIFVANDFDPADKVFLTDFAHELYHVLVDDERRKILDEKTYFRYWEESERHGVVVVFDEEANAYAVKLWLMNVITRGKFKAQIRRRKSVAVPSGNANLINNAGNWGRSYFGESPKNFREYLRNQYLQVLPGFIEFTPDLKPLPRR